jgi:hypothetical protein
LTVRKRKKPRRKVAGHRAAPHGKRSARRTAARAEPVPESTTRRWNPDPEDVQRSVIKLVLSLVELIRKLMERQAIRRLEERTLTSEEIENVGLALMRLEQTVEEIAQRFGLRRDELNLDLGPIGRLH